MKLQLQVKKTHLSASLRFLLNADKSSSFSYFTVPFNIIIIKLWEQGRDNYPEGFFSSYF